VQVSSVVVQKKKGGREKNVSSVAMQDWQIPLGRRFRALKVWFVLRTYGQEGLQKYLEHHLRLAKLFQGFVEADDRFEIMAPPRFGLICFALTVENNSQTQLHLTSQGLYIPRLAQQQCKQTIAPILRQGMHNCLQGCVFDEFHAAGFVTEANVSSLSLNIPQDCRTLLQNS